MLHGSWRDRQLSNMRAVLELVQLGYLPMVVTLGPNPSGMQAESLQLVADGLLKAPGHIRYVSEWCQLFNVQSLTILAFIHGLDELVPIMVPLSAVERGDLAGIKTPHHMN